LLERVEECPEAFVLRVEVRARPRSGVQVGEAILSEAAKALA
jgi:hypothetical protein